MVATRMEVLLEAMEQTMVEVQKQLEDELQSRRFLSVQFVVTEGTLGVGEMMRH